MTKPKNTQDKSILPVMESFFTIQGEGYHQGKAAYFIRLGGCDVGCVWCDVKDSWDATKHPQISVSEIVRKANSEVSNESEQFDKTQLHSNNKNPVIAVVTGGEPLLHELSLLTNELKRFGFKTNIETSGSSPLSGSWDWICLSPKKFKAPLQDVIKAADELKIVIFNIHDFDWAESFAKQVKPTCKLYLQPEWEKRNIVTPLIVKYIKSNPKWELSLQLHKYIDVP